MKKIKAEELLKKYKDKTITDDELAMLESWYNNTLRDDDFPDLDAQAVAEDLSRIDFPVPSAADTPRIMPRFKILMAAAAVLVMMIAVGYFFFYSPSTKKQPSLASTSVSADSNTVLVLNKNEPMTLKKNVRGNIATETGVTIERQSTGELRYEIVDSLKAAQASAITSTISTGKGGNDHIQLADGTHVWLNSQSSITVPLAFNGKERRVSINGEVYFEVKKNARLPFRVVSKNQVLEVLGTHFNVQAYDDDKETITTLLEGSVRIANNSSVKILKPGEQAKAAEDGEISVYPVDVNDAVSWREDYFIFKNETITSIMTTLSRWYNIEVEYAHVNNTQTFAGKISRKKSLQQVLDILQLTGKVHFKVTGRKVLVME